MISYVPTSIPSSFESWIFKLSASYTVPVTVDVNSASSSPYTVVLLSAVTVTLAGLIVNVAFLVTVPT